MTARGSALRFKALGADTDRRFSLFEREVPVGARRPAAHRHPGTSEAFYVLDGTLALHVEDVDHRIERGGFALVPAGVAHTFGNGGPEVLRVLIVHAPALSAAYWELRKQLNEGAVSAKLRMLSFLSSDLVNECRY